jgi:hypothetical protein
MIIRNVPITPALAAWLCGAHDDDQPELIVRLHGHIGATPFTVLRADGSPPSPTEEQEVRALLAAHAAEPLTMPTK